MTFHANNDTEQNKTQTGELGAYVALDENIFSWNGHSFAKWNTKQDGTGVEYNDKQFVKLNVDIELYAQWDNAPANNDKIIFGAIGLVVGLVVGLLVMALVKRY